MTPPRTFTLSVIGIFVAAAVLPLAYMTMTIFWQQEPTGVFEARLLSLAGNSLKIAGGSSLAALIVGVMVAVLGCRTNLPGRKFIERWYLLPLFIPPYIHAIVWTKLNPMMMERLGVDLYSIYGAIFILTIAYFPFVTMTTMAGLKSIDTRQEEAALLIRPPISIFLRVTLPLCLPNILSGAMLVFVFAMVNVSVADILRINVYPLEIFIQFSAFFNTPAATLLSLPMVALTLILILCQLRYMGNRSYVHMGGGKVGAFAFDLKPFKALFLTLVIIIFACSVAVPVITLIRDAGAPGIYLKVIKTSTSAIWRTLFMAAVSALFITLLGGAMGYLIKCLKKRAALLLMLLVLLPFAVPSTTMGIGLIGVWNHAYFDWIYSSMVIMLFAYTARFSAYVSLVVQSGAGQISPRMEETAYLSGAGFISRLKTIVLPLAKKHLGAGALIVFILVCGELETTLLVTPAGVETIPIKIYNLMHYGAHEMVAALCLILMIIIFAVYSVIVWTASKI